MTIEQQFNEFIVENLESARKFAGTYVKNPQDADDVVSESIEKALRKIHTLKDPDRMKTWFFKIIITTSMSHLRKTRNTVPISDEFQLHSEDDFSHLDFGDLLELLPAEDKQIVSLRFYHNCALGEIAEILGMNENTVKTRLYRALKKLKLEITDNGAGVAVKKGRSAAGTTSAVVVAVLLTAALVLNLSPALAAAAYEIPVIGNIVRVITFNRFEFKDNGYEADIVTPEIQGLLDPELEARLNAEFHEFADDLIRSFEASIPKLAELGIDELNGQPAHMSVKADYTVKTDNDEVLSLATYLYSDVGGYVIYKFYNIDKRTGTPFTLADLFKPGADYITPISAYLIAEMERRNEEEDGVYAVSNSSVEQGDHFTAIHPNHNFYINGDGKLVICFDKYEVAAGFMGSPEFVIPGNVIQDIVQSNLIR